MKTMAIVWQVWQGYTRENRPRSCLGILKQFRKAPRMSLSISCPPLVQYIKFSLILSGSSILWICYWNIRTLIFRMSVIHKSTVWQFIDTNSLLITTRKLNSTSAITRFHPCSCYSGKHIFIFSSLT